jgi:hypothetical protein
MVQKVRWDDEDLVGVEDSSETGEHKTMANPFPGMHQEFQIESKGLSSVS